MLLVLAVAMVAAALPVAAQADPPDALNLAAGRQPVLPSVQASAPLYAEPSADCAVPGRDDRCEAWVSARHDAAGMIDTPGNGGWGGRSLVTSPDGKRLYVTGTSQVGPAVDGFCDCDAVTMAYDAQTGATLWTAAHAGSGAHATAIAESVTVSADGDTVYTTSAATAAGTQTCTGSVHAFDAADGRLRWHATLGNPAVGCAFPLAMTAHASSAGETVYLAVTEHVANGPAIGQLVALDGGTGALRYTASDAAASGRVVTTVGVSPDGQTVFLGGHDGAHDGGHGGLRVFSAMAFRASSGELLWSVHDPKTAEFDAHLGATGLALSPDGSQLFLTGGDLRNGANNVAGVTTVGSSAEQGLLTQAYDAATGEPQWRVRYAPLSPILGDSTGHSSMGQNIAVTPDGSRVIVTATSEEVLRSRGWAVIAYDSQTGEQVWEESARDHPYVLLAIGFSPLIAISPQGDAVYVTGLMGNASTTPFVTAAYDVQSGTQRWVGRWSPQAGGPALATSIAVAPDGTRLYVAGSARSVEQPEVPGDSWDIVTVAYDTADAVP